MSSRLKTRLEGNLTKLRGKIGKPKLNNPEEKVEVKRHFTSPLLYKQAMHWIVRPHTRGAKTLCKVPPGGVEEERAEDAYELDAAFEGQRGSNGERKSFTEAK